MVCSCDQAMKQKHKLVATSREVSKELDGFLKREESYYCIHLCTARKAANTEFDIYSIPIDENPDPFVDILSTSSFLAAVYDGASYGLISCTHSNAATAVLLHHVTISCFFKTGVTGMTFPSLFPHIFHSPQEPATNESIEPIMALLFKHTFIAKNGGHCLCQSWQICHPI